MDYGLHFKQGPMAGCQPLIRLRVGQRPAEQKRRRAQERGQERGTFASAIVIIIFFLPFIFPPFIFPPFIIAGVGGRRGGTKKDQTAKRGEKGFGALVRAIDW
jgi:hypothetical protein